MEYKIGKRLFHKKYGEGVIIKDEEGLCKSDEVMFKPNDNSKMGIVTDDHGDKALWSRKGKFDIVKKADLRESEKVLSWDMFLNEAGVPTTFSSDKEPGEQTDKDIDISPAPRKEEAEEVKTLIGKDDYKKFVEELGELAKDSKVKNLIKSGLKDGVKEEDRLYVSHAIVKVIDLIPTQKEIDIDKSLRYPLTSPLCAKMYIDGKNVKIAGMDIVTLNEKYVIDGHHRWSQVFAINPYATMSSKDISGISDPMLALKSLQIAIVADIGEVPVNKVEGSNMILSSEKEILDYVKEKTTDEVMEVYRDANIANDREELAKFIWGNVQIMQRQNRPIANAPERGVMPQTDDAKNALDMLAKGTVNLKAPFIKEMKATDFDTFLSENKGIQTENSDFDLSKFIADVEEEMSWNNAKIIKAEPDSKTYMYLEDMLGKKFSPSTIALLYFGMDGSSIRKDILNACKTAGSVTAKVQVVSNTRRNEEHEYAIFLNLKK